MDMRRPSTRLYHGPIQTQDRPFLFSQENAMSPQQTLYIVGMIAGGLAILGMGLGLLALAIHEREEQ